MFDELRHRVLLPKWVYESNELNSVKKNIKSYLSTCYPHYIFVREENGFAICDRKES